MIEKNWKRARSTEQMEHRELEILGAAESLFTTMPYEKITLQNVARQAGFSQSNLYRYFKTKEEIFLRIYLTDLENWERDLTASIGTYTSPEDFLEFWTVTLCNQKRMLLLAPLLATVLERNSSEEVYRRTKSEILKLMERSLPLISASLHGLTPDSIREFMMAHNAVMAGLLPMTRHSDMQTKVLKELGLEEILIDFKIVYKRTMLLYLKGLLAELDG